jgi:quercetin dioxygenase-like cupin family protein
VPFYNWKELAEDNSVYRPAVGGGGTITGQSIEVGDYYYPKGHRPGRHAHEHEQIVTLLEGKMRVVLGDEERIVVPGQVFHVPSNLPHEVEVLEDSHFLSSKNLVGGMGSAAPRTWFEMPHGGKGLTELEKEQWRKAQEAGTLPKGGIDPNA